MCLPLWKVLNKLYLNVIKLVFDLNLFYAHYGNISRGCKDTFSAVAGELRGLECEKPGWYKIVWYKLCVFFLYLIPTYIYIYYILYSEDSFRESLFEEQMLK